MNPWQWIEDIQLEAYQTGDHEKLRLASIYFRAHELSHDLPTERLALFEQGRKLALRLNEPWWALYFEHWVVETLLFGTQQPQLALDRVVRAVVESRKPVYNAFPQRLDLHLNLIGAYLSVDPIGYRDKLLHALDYVEAEGDPHPFKRAYVKQLRGYFLEAIGEAGAVNVAWDYLQIAEEAQSEHFQWDALSLLCTVLYRFEPETARETLADIAQFGEQVARREERNRGIVTFLMWQAVAARWAGQEPEAARLYARATELQKRVPPPRGDIHTAAIAFHREGGEWESALSVCQSSVCVYHRHHLTFLEAQRRLEKCRLLSHVGRDWSREARRLLRVGSSLVSKEHWESQLAALREGAL